MRGSGALVITAMLDFLTFALCAPYSETTDSAYFDSLLEMVAEDGRVIFKLFQHPSMAIVKGAGMVMKAIIEVRIKKIFDFPNLWFMLIFRICIVSP